MKQRTKGPDLRTSIGLRDFNDDEFNDSDEMGRSKAIPIGLRDFNDDEFNDSDEMGRSKAIQDMIKSPSRGNQFFASRIAQEILSTSNPTPTAYEIESSTGMGGLASPKPPTKPPALTTDLVFGSGPKSVLSPLASSGTPTLRCPRCKRQGFSDKVALRKHAIRCRASALASANNQLSPMIATPTSAQLRDFDLPSPSKAPSRLAGLKARADLQREQCKMEEEDVLSHHLRRLLREQRLTDVVQQQQAAALQERLNRQKEDQLRREKIEIKRQEELKKALKAERKAKKRAEKERRRKERELKRREIELRKAEKARLAEEEKNREARESFAMGAEEVYMMKVHRRWRRERKELLKSQQLEKRGSLPKIASAEVVEPKHPEPAEAKPVHRAKPPPLIEQSSTESLEEVKERALKQSVERRQLEKLARKRRAALLARQGSSKRPLVTPKAPTGPPPDSVSVKPVPKQLPPVAAPESVESTSGSPDSTVPPLSDEKTGRKHHHHHHHRRGSESKEHGSSEKRRRSRTKRRLEAKLKRQLFEESEDGSASSPVDKPPLASSPLPMVGNAAKTFVLVKAEPPVELQPEPVKAESPVEQKPEPVKAESPVEQKPEPVKAESPVEQKPEPVKAESPVELQPEPMKAEPPVELPVKAESPEPVKAEPPVELQPEPVKAESPVEQKPGPVKAESPVEQKPGPVKAESPVELQPEPVKAEPPVELQPDPAKAEPPVELQPDPAKAEPPVELQPEPVKAESPVEQKPEPVKAESPVELQPEPMKAESPVELQPEPAKAEPPVELQPEPAKVVEPQADLVAVQTQFAVMQEQFLSRLQTQMEEQMKASLQLQEEARLEAERKLLEERNRRVEQESKFEAFKSEIQREMQERLEAEKSEMLKQQQELAATAEESKLNAERLLKEMEEKRDREVQSQSDMLRKMEEKREEEHQIQAEKLRYAEERREEERREQSERLLMLREERLAREVETADRLREQLRNEVMSESRSNLHLDIANLADVAGVPPLQAAWATSTNAEVQQNGSAFTFDSEQPGSSHASDANSVYSRRSHTSAISEHEPEGSTHAGSYGDDGHVTDLEFPQPVGFGGADVGSAVPSPKQTAAPVATVDICAYCQSANVHEVASYGHIQCLETLLSKQPDAVFAVDEYRRTPLHIASTYGHLETLEALLVRGADPEAFDQDARSPLFFACANNHFNVAAVLLDATSDNIDTPDSRGDTPLHAAACNSHAEIVELLLATAANPDVRNFQGHTPVHLAATVACLKPLFDRTPEMVLKAKDKMGRTVLFCGAANNRLDVVQFVLEVDIECVSLNVSDLRGDSPLHAASCNGHLECCRLLLQSGANARLKNLRGLTPTDLAMGNRHNGYGECRCVINAPSRVASVLMEYTRQQTGGTGLAGAVQTTMAVSSAAGVWKAYKDETTGYVYFFNSKTGQSQWEKPSEFTGPMPDQISLAAPVNAAWSGGGGGADARKPSRERRESTGFQFGGGSMERQGSGYASASSIASSNASSRLSIKADSGSKASRLNARPGTRGGHRRRSSVTDHQRKMLQSFSEGMIGADDPRTVDYLQLAADYARQRAFRGEDPSRRGVKCVLCHKRTPDFTFFPCEHACCCARCIRRRNIGVPAQLPRTATDTVREKEASKWNACPLCMKEITNIASIAQAMNAERDYGPARKVGAAFKKRFAEIAETLEAEGMVQALMMNPSGDDDDDEEEEEDSVENSSEGEEEE